MMKKSQSGSTSSMWMAGNAAHHMDFVEEGIFPNGHMFMSLHGNIEFSFPKAGDYRLDITADENKLPTIYHYNIEITNRPA